MSAVARLENPVPFRPQAAPSTSELLALARSRTTADRERLLLGITALCDAAPPADGQTSPVLSEIFLVLAGQA